MLRRLLPPTFVVAALTPALIVWRQFPFQLALLSAVAIAALVYAALRTVENLRELRQGSAQPDIRFRRPGSETQRKD